MKAREAEARLRAWLASGSPERHEAIAAELAVMFAAGYRILAPGEIDKLAAFAETMIRLSWEGCDGGDIIQEEAVKSGLLKQVAFDPALHKDPNGYADAGDSWFVFDGPLESRPKR